MKDNDNLQKILQHVNAGKHHTKVGIDCLIVEITRKCNMKPICKHCMRGLPQNITLSKHAIDNLLSQVSEIGEVGFTGGEPLICLDRIRCFFEAIKHNNIVLHQFKIITNGLLFTREFEKLIYEVDKYISKICPAAPDPHIIIGVSVDQFHSNNQGKIFIDKCIKSFAANSVSIESQVFGANPTRMGLAKALPKWNTVKHFPSHMEKAKIAIWEPFAGTSCPSFNCGNMKDNSQMPIIICPIYLSATGRMYVAAFAGRNDYETVDDSDAICNMNNDSYLLDSVKFYNRNRPSCISAYLLSNTQLADNIGDPEIVSLKDEQDGEVNELLSLMCKVQTRYSEYLSDDRQLASEDMKMILEIQREYEANEISLSIAIGIWIERLKKSGEIANYMVGVSPYTDKRAEIINALLNIDDFAYNFD